MYHIFYNELTTRHFFCYGFHSSASSSRSIAGQCPLKKTPTSNFDYDDYESKSNGLDLSDVVMYGVV